MKFSTFDANRERIRRLARRFRFHGDKCCTMCGGRFDALASVGGDSAVVLRRQVVGAGRREAECCPICGNHARTRMFQLYFEKFILPKGRMTRVLHFAPEYALYSWFKVFPSQIDYTACDIEPGLYPKVGNVEYVDITSLPYADETFDAIVCSHVLEHVPDDRAAMSELYRILRPGGVVLALAPFALDGLGTDEDLSVTDPEERHERYCQHDHVRLYDREDFTERLTRAGFKVRLFDPHSEFPEDAVNMWLNPQELLPIATRSTS